MRWGLAKLANKVCRYLALEVSSDMVGRLPALTTFESRFGSVEISKPNPVQSHASPSSKYSVLLINSLPPEKTKNP